MNVSGCRRGGGGPHGLSVPGAVEWAPKSRGAVQRTASLRHTQPPSVLGMRPNSLVVSFPPTTVMFFYETSAIFSSVKLLFLSVLNCLNPNKSKTKD